MGDGVVPAAWCSAQRQRQFATCDEEPVMARRSIQVGGRLLVIAGPRSYIVLHHAHSISQDGRAWHGGCRRREWDVRRDARQAGRRPLEPSLYQDCPKMLDGLGEVREAGKPSGGVRGFWKGVSRTGGRSSSDGQAIGQGVVLVAEGTAVLGYI